ncbi:DnaA/Hda family protein [Alphaproteobacteria bacterium]|nr:DnaA/Hda family protein [Alphaproteobacteria bacterium]
MSDKPVQYVLALPHRSAYGRDDFIVSACNAEAVAWIDKSEDWPLQCLVISGDTGSGKSHLAAVWKDRTGAVRLEPNQIGWSMAQVETERAGRPLIIDQLENFQNSEGGETFLFHLINHAKEQAASLLILSGQPPAKMSISLKDLASRLLAMPTVSIRQPDDELIRGLYGKLFSERQLTVSEDVVAYLATHAARDFPTITGLVGQLDEQALASKKAITIHLARSVLQAG